VTRLRPRLALLLLPALLLAACGGSSGGGSDSSATAANKTSTSASQAKFAGATASPRKASPPLTLRDYTGKPVDIRTLKGKPVLVTFLYTHCPDICPLIAGHLHTVQAELGAKAKDLNIIAVSTDPRRDTPAAVKKFLAAHRMLGHMHYLLGSPAQLKPVWKQWHVIAEPDSKHPNFVNHSSFIYGIDAQGRLTTLYPANFQPKDVVHDVPLLAAQ
jgi:protein SCO1/2